MIRFGPMSVTLLVCALQGGVLAGLLLRAPRNREANRYLALLILAVVALVTPFILGYAGFYDRWPRLSFAPFSYTLAFGPLLYLYTTSLVGRRPARVAPHFLPVLVQFLADAAVFPLPLAVKDRWDAAVNAPILSPAFDVATLVSLAAYGAASLAHDRAYRTWLDDNRTDGVDFDPRWIRQFLGALTLVAVVWLGFMAADWWVPSRNYFDQFPLYVTFSALVLYLGIAGWRHAGTAFPTPASTDAAAIVPAAEADPAVPGRDWAAQGRTWLARIDAEAAWRDPALTLAGLARRLGTNTTYLSRALNAATGENFNTVINRRRVEEVQRLLAEGGAARPLLELAFDAGFNSKASFNRAFAELAGMPPSAWRLKSQKGVAG